MAAMASWRLGLEKPAGCVGVQRGDIPGGGMKIQKQNRYGAVKRERNMWKEFLLLSKQAPIE